jgi:hypothetical protein
MPWAAEDLIDRRLLDYSPGVQDHDAVGNVANHPEVVADVHDAHLPRARDPLDLIDQISLRGDVEPGRRLIHDHNVRIANKRHGDANALLLPSGELVGIAAQERAIGWKLGFCERSANASVNVLLIAKVNLNYLGHLALDSLAWTQRRSGVLRHVRDSTPAHSRAASHGGRREIDIGDDDTACNEACPRPLHAEQREGCRRLARSRFANNPKRLATTKDKIEAVNYVAARLARVHPHSGGSYERSHPRNRRGGSFNRAHWTASTSSWEAIETRL